MTKVIWADEFDELDEHQYLVKNGKDLAAALRKAKYPCKFVIKEDDGILYLSLEALNKDDIEQVEQIG